MGQTASEIEAQKEPRYNSNGGIDLVDDGTNRLRDVRKTDSHPQDCACLHCRQVCCLLCRLRDPEAPVKIWRGLTGFGRHVQSKHPQVVEFKRDQRKTKALTRQLQELSVAKEAKRFERTGLRRVPLKMIGERELRAISNWIDGARRNRPDELLLTAIELADERFPTKTKFDQAMRRLTMEVERGLKTGTYVTSQRQTHFDPRVAQEVYKLCYATGRGWSFIVHLLLLYGINSFVETLVSEGLVPPTTTTSLPDPAQIVAHQGTDAMTLAGKKPRRTLRK